MATDMESIRSEMRTEQLNARAEKRAAQPEPTPSNALQTRPPVKRPRPNKFSNKRSSKPAVTIGKNSEAKFEKQKDAAIVFSNPTSSFYPIQTCYVGAMILTHILYDILYARDRKMTELFTLREFQYVVLLRTYLRAIEIANTTSTVIIHGLSLLKDSLKSLLLPDVICKYIEMIGFIDTATGCKVFPMIDSYHRMQAFDDFIDPFDLLTLEQQAEVIPNSWAQNDDVIIRVANGMSRALKGVLEIREVKTEKEGSQEFLAAYRVTDGDRMIPLSPERMDRAVLVLGACFRFRNHEWRQHRGEQLPLVQQTDEINSTTILQRWVLGLLKSN